MHQLELLELTVALPTGCHGAIGEEPLGETGDCYLTQETVGRAQRPEPEDAESAQGEACSGCGMAQPNVMYQEMV